MLYNVVFNVIAYINVNVKNLATFLIIINQRKPHLNMIIEMPLIYPGRENGINTHVN